MYDRRIGHVWLDNEHYNGNDDDNDDDDDDDDDDRDLSSRLPGLSATRERTPECLSFFLMRNYGIPRLG